MKRRQDHVLQAFWIFSSAIGCSVCTLLADWAIDGKSFNVWLLAAIWFTVVGAIVNVFWNQIAA
jgi:hypothetical protein